MATRKESEKSSHLPINIISILHPKKRVKEKDKIKVNSSQTSTNTLVKFADEKIRHDDLNGHHDINLFTHFCGHLILNFCCDYKHYCVCVNFNVLEGR